MADNYLEYRQEELSRARTKIVRKSYPSLDTLLHRNRSYRAFDPSRTVPEAELRDILRAVTLTASGMNRQALRFRLVTGLEAAAVLPHITLGGALPQEHLPHPGSEPGAFIVVCATVPEDRALDMDIGFAAQSILLRATEKGLGGVFILNLRRDALKAALGLTLDPLAVIAIGKPAEPVFLRPVTPGEKDPDLRYYRKEGVHYVPKLSVDDLVLPHAEAAGIE